MPPVNLGAIFKIIFRSSFVEVGVSHRRLSDLSGRLLFSEIDKGKKEGKNLVVHVKWSLSNRLRTCWYRPELYSTYVNKQSFLKHDLGGFSNFIPGFENRCVVVGTTFLSKST